MSHTPRIWELTANCVSLAYVEALLAYARDLHRDNFNAQDRIRIRCLSPEIADVVRRVAREQYPNMPIEVIV